MTPTTDQPVAIVSGATSGIGLVIARDLVAEGYRVVATGRSIDRGKELERKLDGGGVFVQADLARPGGASSVVSRAEEVFGRVDVVVNNAALDHTGSLVDTPSSEVRQTFEVNAFAAIEMLQSGAKAMIGKKCGGAIINITSRLALIGVPTMGIYSASKGAISSLTRTAAIELAPYNIRVNAVAPGMTRTPLYESWLEGLPDPAAAEEGVVADIPLKRLAEPEDVAAVVAFLASPSASYLTGTTIPVDGGYLAK